ncbi:MAG: nucleotidyltransferase domain-containing protein [Planctomycetota bacterium]|nr:nucleotidyltransferase domain-containing protein [Planctomycetota bacterium]
MLIPDLSIARRFLGARPAPGPIVQCAITGAHIYGFPSEDSDLDIKGLHMAPAHQILGLGQAKEAHDALEIFEGVECDLTTHEARPALVSLLQGNGNMLERFTSPFQLVDGFEELAAMARASVSKASFRHYRGYLKGMRHEHGLKHRAKTALYCYRVALTGVHLLNTGEIEPNLTVLAPEYGIQVQELVDFKRENGEKCPLPKGLDNHHMAAFDGLDAMLADALEGSSLPATPPNRDAVEDWLQAERRRGLL